MNPGLRRPLTQLCCLVAVLVVGAARPNAEVSQRDARAQTVLDTSDPMARRHQPQEPVQTLAYYGGAKGQYLVIHPSGRRTVSRTPPPLRAHKPPKEEEDVGMAPDEEQESESEGDNDSVAINPPPENASVAEAKPVALAIAGPGGVASAKPVGQAIVGPGGLAVARPVATAVAGVKGGGLQGAVVAAGGGKDQPEAASYQRQVYFNPETNQLHASPIHGQSYLYPINLYN